MLLSNSNFPILSTKRIVVSKDFENTPESTTTRNVFVTDGQGGGSLQSQTTTTPASSREFTKAKVEFLLKSREATSLSRWFSQVDSELAQYLKIYFMALDDSSSSFAGFLQDPQTRYRTLKSLPSLGILRGQSFRSAGNSISMAQVLQNNFFATTPVSDMSGDYYHDIYGELEIDISPLDLENTSRVHLIGFIHMDVDTYLLDKGYTLDPTIPDPIESKGSDLIYDLLLQTGNQGLEVPLFRNVFYVEQEVQTTNLEGQEVTRTDLVGYYGPAHYHDQDNPGPGGYIGWMAGAGGQDMGPRLEVRSVRNYKVVSSIYDLEKSDIFGVDTSFGDPASSTGQGLESYLNSVIDLEEQADQSRKLEELVKASSYSESKTKNNFMKSSDTPMNYVSSVNSQDQGTGELTNEKSHHAVVFGLDYLLLVMARSNYGDIINFHHNHDNEEMIGRFLGSSKILKLDITRERVTNNPYSFSETDSLAYKVYDSDQPRKMLVTTQDDLRLRPLRPGEVAYKGHLIPCSSELASISEIDLATEQDGEIVSIPGFNRFFCIKDYDLFHNVQTGQYRHNLNLTIIDGVHKVITQILEKVNFSISQVNEMLTDATQPVIRNQQGVYVQGSYDHAAGDFHSSFKQKDYSSTVNSALIAFSEASQFFSGARPHSSVIDQIECALDPRSTNLETLNHFYTVLNNMSSGLERLLHLNGDTTYREDLKKQGKTYTPASGPGSKSRTIQVSVDCLEIVEAISDGSLMANYSNYQETDSQNNDSTPDTPNLGFFDYLSRAGSILGRVTNTSIMPASYSVFSASPYRVENLNIRQNTIEPLFQEVSNNSIKFISKSSPRVLSSFGSYQAKSGLLRTNEEVMISAMRSRDNVSSGFVNKPIHNVINGSFAMAGFEIKPIGNLSSAGGSQSISLKRSSASKEKLKESFEKQSRDNCLELSSELKAAIQNAAFNGVTREEVVDIVEKNYKDLIDIVGTIGSIYDNMIPILGALQNTADQAARAQSYLPTSQDLFLGRDNNNLDQKLEAHLAYTHDAAKMKLVAPGMDSKEVSISSASNWKVKEGQLEKVVMVKLEPTKKEDGIVPVNNGYLLRI